jgi:hypothetical protein
MAAMRITRASFVLAALALGSQSAWAHGPAADPRYRVDEVRVPASNREDCLPEYSRNANAAAMNDFGVSVASFVCYTVVDPAAVFIEQKSGLFAGSPWFGSLELPQESGTYGAWATSINNRGNVFGSEPLPDFGFAGAIWSVGGGRQRVFDDESCGFIRQSAAAAGNARFTVGWAYRADASLPPPYDTLCITIRWLIRNAAGVESPGPLNGNPQAINAFDVAVGNVNRAAVSYHVPTGKLRVLHAADDAFSADASSINDLGEAAGVVRQNSSPGVTSYCDRHAAVRWARDGRETSLPHLPGAVSSRAFSVGYNGETVGDSGAGAYCSYLDGRRDLERAVLWRGARAMDLNTLIPRSAGITLTSAASVNRLGQILATGWVNDEPLTKCAEYAYDTGSPVLKDVPCRRLRVFQLTPR